MSKNAKHARLTADHAVRLALGAYYNATAGRPGDGPALVGAWMLELSRKLGEDDITRAHYREIIRRWEAEENASLVSPDNEQFARLDNRLHNDVTRGLENA
jgi:hypothetical protein